jgi:hypothetical protein
VIPHLEAWRGSNAPSQAKNIFDLDRVFYIFMCVYFVSNNTFYKTDCVVKRKLNGWDKFSEI